METITEVWSVSDYVTQFFGPCIAIGAILPAFGSLLAGYLRSFRRVVGIDE